MYIYVYTYTYIYIYIYIYKHSGTVEETWDFSRRLKLPRARCRAILTLTVLYVPYAGLDCLKCAICWPWLSYMCHMLVLTFLYMPYAGLDCLSWPLLSYMCHIRSKANLGVQEARKVAEGARSGYSGLDCLICATCWPWLSKLVLTVSHVPQSTDS